LLPMLMRDCDLAEHAHLDMMSWCHVIA